jgi:hypothetical protein
MHTLYERYLCMIQQLLAVEASLRDLQAALVPDAPSEGKRDESPTRGRKPIDMKAIVSSALSFRDQNRALNARMTRRDLSVSLLCDTPLLVAVACLVAWAAR